MANPDVTDLNQIDPNQTERDQVHESRTEQVAADLFQRIAKNMELVFRGKREQVDLALTTIVSGGHLLIDDVPGVGKTLLAKALATSIGAQWRRVQFTADLLPSDVIGVTLYNQKTGGFEYREGPVFTHVLLCDEINRAPEKTQAALLEAMEERAVTVDATTRLLPNPFFVIATQNPIEQRGTYTLPESQLDRFTMRLSLGYPDRIAAMSVLDSDGTDVAFAELRSVASIADLAWLIDAARNVHAADALKGYVLDMTEATRRHPAVRLGVSPRGSLALLRGARAQALQAGRSFITPDDVQALAIPVLAHRLLLDSRSSRSVSDVSVIEEIVASTPVPVRRSR
jgi:MoxR-like ATPase